MTTPAGPDTVISVIEDRLTGLYDALQKLEGNLPKPSSTLPTHEVEHARHTIQSLMDQMKLVRDEFLPNVPETMDGVLAAATMAQAYLLITEHQISSLPSFEAIKPTKPSQALSDVVRARDELRQEVINALSGLRNTPLPPVQPPAPPAATTTSKPNPPTVSNPPLGGEFLPQGASQVTISGRADPNVQIQIFQTGVSRPLAQGQADRNGIYSILVVLPVQKSSSTPYLFTVTATANNVSSDPTAVSPLYPSPALGTIDDLITNATDLSSDLSTNVPNPESLSVWLADFFAHLVGAEAVLSSVGSISNPMPSDAQVAQLTAAWQTAVATSGGKANDPITGDPATEGSLTVLVEGQMVTVYSQLEKITTRGDLIGARS